MTDSKYLNHIEKEVCMSTPSDAKLVRSGLQDHMIDVLVVKSDLNRCQVTLIKKRDWD